MLLHFAKHENRNGPFKKQTFSTENILNKWLYRGSIIGTDTVMMYCPYTLTLILLNNWDHTYMAMHTTHTVSCSVSGKQKNTLNAVEQASRILESYIVNNNSYVISD